MQHVPASAIAKLEKELTGPAVWKIMTYFSVVIIFVYKEREVNPLKKSSLKTEWTTRIFDLLKPYDEFDYFEKSQFSIEIDSKENFETNYESNWYYYFK